LRWLRSTPATGWLHKHDGFELVVFRRWPSNSFFRGRVSVLIWRSSNSTELEDRLPARAFTAVRLDALLDQVGDPEWNKPGFHLRRPWPKGSALELRDNVVAELATGLGELQAVCDVINGHALGGKLNVEGCRTP
jgi:hypothetical protein